MTKTQKFDFSAAPSPAELTDSEKIAYLKGALREMDAGTKQLMSFDEIRHAMYTVRLQIDLIKPLIYEE